MPTNPNDLVSADVIELMVRKHTDGYRIWVNVNGVNHFRAYRVGDVVLDVRDMKVETGE